MQQKKKAEYRLLALFISLSFFSLLFSGNCIRSSDNSKVNSHNHILGVSNHKTCEFINIEPTDELVTSSIPRISRYHTPKGFNQPKYFIYCLKNSLLSLLAAFVLYVIINCGDSTALCSRRYIIKYIHDQDGHKP